MFCSKGELESDVLDDTHLVRVQISELSEVHLDFFVRDLEPLEKRSRA